MRLQTLRLVWPREVLPDQSVAMARVLSSVGGAPVVLEALGRKGRVEHRLRVPQSRVVAVTNQLRATLPGIGVENDEIVERSDDDASNRAASPPVFNHAVDLRLSTKRRPLQVEQSEMISRTMLAVLAYVGQGEALLLQWVLQSHLAAIVVPSKIDQLHHESLWRALLIAPFRAPGPADVSTRNAMRDKYGEPGWRALGRIAVRAATRSRQDHLIRSTVDALRVAHAPGVHFKLRPISPESIGSSSGKARLRLNVSEVAALSTWPIGQTTERPVVRLGSRRLPPLADRSTTGRVIGDSTWPGERQPLRLSIEDSLRHLHVIGPTGTGKSTLLLNLIEQDMQAGRSVVVIEPKGDLINDVLARVPKLRAEDVVLLDPTDETAMVGINPLATSRTHGSAELVADQLLNTFHGLYAASWGPRTSDILHAALLTLARTPGMSLVALPMLLGDPVFRRRIIGGLNDPIGLGPFWAHYEAWSDAERITATAPVMNKLRPFLMRPSLRRIIGQPSPRFDLVSVFTSRKILLVNAAKGQMGQEAASLLGALVVSGLWQAASSRAGLAKEQRHPVMIYIDEFQDYLHLPTDLGEALAQARGLGVSFTLAHQHLTQLGSDLRAGVLANARSRICFQLGHDDARIISQSSSNLSPEDFSSLDAFHFYAQLMNHGAVSAWASGRSLPPSEPNNGSTASASEVRNLSRQQWGTKVEDIDQALLELASPNRGPTASAEDLSPKRRVTRRSES
jgi:Type IV secretion-system coupling protein DNA-binding domain